jgi:hypothetical protein
MHIDSTQKFHAAQEALVHPSLAIPVIAIGPSLAKIVVSLAQIIHGLAMAAFYAIQGTKTSSQLKDNYLISAREGFGNLVFGIVNCVTIGIFFLSLSLCCSFQTRNSVYQLISPKV